MYSIEPIIHAKNRLTRISWVCVLTIFTPAFALTLTLALNLTKTVKKSYFIFTPVVVDADCAGSKVDTAGFSMNIRRASGKTVLVEDLLRMTFVLRLQLAFNVCT